MITMSVQGRTCVKGIDISDWQGNVDHNAVASSGVAFVVAKATEGTTYRAKTFIPNRVGAKAAGMKFAAYHWIKPSSSGAAQANHFLTYTNNAQDCDFVVLDAEEAGLTNDHIRDWCDTVKVATGKPIAIYCGTWTDPKIREGFWNDHTPWLAAYPAGYTVDPDPAKLKAPVNPSPWGRWDIWQYSSSGRVPGVSGNCDVNVADINWFNTLGGDAQVTEEEDMHWIQRTNNGNPWLCYSSGIRLNLATLDGITGEGQVAALRFVGVEERPMITDPNADWWITRTGVEPVSIQAEQTLTKMILEAIGKVSSGELVEVDPEEIADAVLAALKEKL